MGESVLEEYDVVTDEGLKARVRIKKVGDFVPHYQLELPKISEPTLMLLDKIKLSLLTQVPVKTSEALSLTVVERMKKEFLEKAMEMMKKEFPSLKKEERFYLAGLLVDEMFGLGKIEFLLADGNLEEIVINNSKEPVWVYHKKHGWIKTNLKVKDENEILNYANTIGRRVGRQITILNPLMDAHLPSGDRVNATLFPISSHGNTLTIRKFRRSPWTITDFIENRTLNLETASWLWLSVQYELNVIVAGGTASGKTSLLNVILNFVPPNHRVISIEDTRELCLPEFLHWIPLTTREPNPEGLGEVKMLDLLVNSLRMRPDRIVVGEIRRAEEAEVLFEAMHTGHSVYATLHADTAEQAYKRLTNPPISVPEVVMEALHLIAVVFRDRRTGRRRLFQLAEILPGGERGGTKINVLFKWRPSRDEILKENESYRLLEEIRMHTGMSDEELREDLERKKEILEWFVKKGVRDVNTIGRIVGIYYADPEYVVKSVRKMKDVKEVVEGFFA